MAKFIAIIPARGGSKGIPMKNIYPVNGHPLLYYTIQASLKSRYITDTIVSSDNDEILEIAERYGAIPMKRPDVLSGDHVLTEPVIEYVVNNIKDFKLKYNYIVVLQATSPMRTYRHIDEAVELLLEKKALSLISVKQVDNVFLKSFFISDNNRLIPVSDVRYPFIRRQDLPSVYSSNGAIYIVSTEAFFKNNKLYTDNTVPYIMDERSSTDIDVIDDLLLCERLLNR